MTYRNILMGKAAEVGIYTEPTDTIEQVERAFREKGVTLPVCAECKIDVPKEEAKPVEKEEVEDAELVALKEEAKTLGLKGFGNTKSAEKLKNRIEEFKAEQVEETETEGEE